MTDRTFAEYAGNPDSRVEIHYWFEKAVMNILRSFKLWRLFCKRIYTFYSESVRYYFVEELEVKQESLIYSYAE